jgi:hypothetical protein
MKMNNRYSITLRITLLGGIVSAHKEDDKPPAEVQLKVSTSLKDTSQGGTHISKNTLDNVEFNMRSGTK